MSGPGAHGTELPIGPRASALELRGITKRFGAVTALDGVGLSVQTGTVHAVIGENGAGKSTLMRVVAGLVAPDAGEIVIAGRPFARLDPRRSIGLGVGMVHQHFMLVDTLSVAENVVLGREPRRGPFLDARASRELVRNLAAEHGLPVDPDARVGELSVGERQRVEILKVLYRGAKLLILDEPTAVLTPVETRALLDVVAGLARGGATVVLVTHKLDEVMRVASRATVLRRGRHEGDVTIADTTPADLARRMVGREVVLGQGPPRVRPLDEGTPTVLALRGVTVARRRAAPALDDVSLEVRAGEVLGIAGVEGNGQRELAGVVAGLVRPIAGRVLVKGDDVAALPPAAHFARGVGHIAEDRQRLGLVLALSLWENLSLGGLDALSRLGLLRESAMRARARALVERFDIRPRDETAPASSLSGGNQQKVVVARELSRGAGSPTVLVASQPTRGVDVGAIEEIWRRIGEARDAGCAVLLVSSDLGELLALSDRIAVMVRGRIVATLARADADTEKLGALMLGARAQASRTASAEA